MVLTANFETHVETVGLYVCVPLHFLIYALIKSLLWLTAVR